METGREDLRVIKTKESIHKAFKEMICEMDYEKITIKELTKRARINRKTFYLHYNNLDDLLKELQDTMAKEFIKRTKDFRRPEDLDKITREFFLVCESNGKFYERLLCSGSYFYIGRTITNTIMDETWDEKSTNKKIDPFTSSLRHK